MLTTMCVHHLTLSFSLPLSLPLSLITAILVYNGRIWGISNTLISNLKVFQKYLLDAHKLTVCNSSCGTKQLSWVSDTRQETRKMYVRCLPLAQMQHFAFFSSDGGKERQRAKREDGGREACIAGVSMRAPV